jgi:hypothetical protein
MSANEREGEVKAMFQKLLGEASKRLTLSVLGLALATSLHSAVSLASNYSGGIDSVCKTDNETLAEIKSSQDSLLWTFIQGVCGDRIDIAALRLSARNYPSVPSKPIADWTDLASEVEINEGDAVIKVAIPILEALLNPPLELRVLEFKIVEPFAFLEVHPGRLGNEEIQTETTNLPPSHIGVRSRLLFERNGSSWTLVEGEVGSSHDWYSRVCAKTPSGLMKSCDITVGSVQR